MKNLRLLPLVLLIVTLVGCASQGTTYSDRDQSRKIIDIVIDEEPDSLIVGIRGNQKLNHQAAGQVHPRKIELFFPATGLDGVRGRFVPPDNGIIRSIKLNERVVNETTNSIVFISLKSDSRYTVAPDKHELRVTFPKTPATTDKIKPPASLEEKTIARHPEPNLVETLATSVPTATILQTVTTQVRNQAVTVNVDADGTINNYSSFTLVEPDRIVFDLPQVKSPHLRERNVPVHSKLIKRIRYFGHPDKLRLVIETHPASRPKYSSSSTNTGLKITVGASE